MSPDIGPDPRPDRRLLAIALRLDRWRCVPTSVLDGIVSGDGGCGRTLAGPLFWSSVPATDRELAEWTCAPCGQRDACLELELRTAGTATVGVWGGLSEQDRRALHPLWLVHRAQEQGGGADDGA